MAINGTHYIDDGVPSANNAGLASGCTNVIVLSPLTGLDRAPGLSWTRRPAFPPLGPVSLRAGRKRAG